MRSTLLIGALGLIVLAAGCMSVPPEEEDERGKLVRAERDFDPLAQDRERPIVITKQGEESTGTEIPQEDQPSPGLPEDSLSMSHPGVTQGYRVQIYLSDSLPEAARVMAEARERFQEEVYLEYDAPYYKVRVGDCQTESMGQELLKTAHDLGYKDAWLVYTTINLAEEMEPQ